MALPPRRVVLREFWDEVVGRGTSPGAAGHAAGATRWTGQRWFRDAGGVKPRLVAACRTGPRPRLTLHDRIEIQAGTRCNESIRSIAARLGRAPSTIKREIDSNGAPEWWARAGRKSGYRRKEAFGAWQGSTAARATYAATLAQARSDQRAGRPKPGKLARRPRLLAEVQQRLGDRHSPEQISGALAVEHPSDREMRVSHETIYKAIYLQGRGALRKELHACLRTGRALRKPRRGARPGTRGRIPGMVNISERPPEASDRAVPGHWEGDLIVGPESRSAIGTLVERRSGLVLLVHLPDDHTAASVAARTIEKMQALPRIARRTLTWDQGTEMSLHAKVAMGTGMQVYFCDPHSPWQRPTNENTNGLLRQYFPKGSDLSVYPPDYLDYVAMQLNTRPRKRHGFRKPIDVFNEILSEPSSVASTA
ncbi:IS30 family transposase [Lolliginicoccus suaedae]|uniref:IS30 family transposase n=1 Tax=Lolliginicoccus suaedae TaxID=2605429 RepID=UPI0038B2A64C